MYVLDAGLHTYIEGRGGNPSTFRIVLTRRYYYASYPRYRPVLVRAGEGSWHHYAPARGSGQHVGAEMTTISEAKCICGGKPHAYLLRHSIVIRRGTFLFSASLGEEGDWGARGA